MVDQIQKQLHKKKLDHWNISCWFWKQTNKHVQRIRVKKKMHTSVSNDVIIGKVYSQTDG